MVPLPITEDYYLVLEVVQTATPELINRSYRRLALKLHPDRNAKHDATEAFQLLVQAYETLKDENKRRAYDLIYPSITRSRPSPQTTQIPRSPPDWSAQSEALSEAAQIAAFQRSKQERGARWLTKKRVFDSSISELQRDIRRLEQEIRNLDSIVAAEAREEAQKNSWGTWLLSPLYKKAEESEDEKARKDRERQERRIEKDMKERRLGPRKADLEKEQSLFRKAKEEMRAADLIDDTKIRVTQDRMYARETRERQEREKAERERVMKIWKQQQEQREKQAREAAEALRQQQAERRAAELKRQEKEARKRQRIIDEHDGTKRFREQRAHRNVPKGSTSTCRHGGWWPKVQGRTTCPTCDEIWTFLLQCPGCEMRACPRCQATIRPVRSYRRAPPEVRTPSPDFDYYDWD
ncbi:DnaJ-domain-containing protein [Lophium mytilinum]|uniref:DnaJ-domain-containing protein n=1 Tax=Lophium mytilinum TaxID=390894 RepID=A0A6A6R5D3_9PEZI|nr:DnaJ-domain-containing protein [Lophium mytilinum]